jgi:hypothetical protein
MSNRFPVLVAGVVGVMFVVLGLWAFVAPQSFFDTTATFEPYNPHFLHDIGSFMLGLGAVLLLATRMSDGLGVALWGVGVGNAFHLISHVMDTDLGGKPATDIPFFAAIAIVLFGAAWARTRGRRPS